MTKHAPGEPKSARGAAALAPRGADFDAHAPERARSTLFSAARVDLQRRLLVWARAVAGRFADLGIPVQVSVSDALPSGKNGHAVERQEVTLQFRRKGGVLKLGVDAESIHLGVRLDGAPELDAIDDAVPTPARASRVAAAFAALPEQLELGLDDPWTRVPVRSVTELRHLARRARAEGRPIAVSFRVPRDVALLFASSLGASFADAAVAIGELLRALGATGATGERAQRKVSTRALERGARVCPIEGPFAGREGLIQELDGRGGARVLFGLLAVHIDLADLRPALQPRLRLGSSHRSLAKRLKA